MIKRELGLNWPATLLCVLLALGPAWLKGENQEQSGAPIQSPFPATEGLPSAENNFSGEGVAAKANQGKPAQPPMVFETTKKMEFETRLMMNFLGKLHFYNKPIHKADFKAFLAKYLKALDYQHIYFLQSEVDRYVNRFAEPLQFYLYQGNLYPAFEIFLGYKKRALERTAWALDRLHKTFNLQSSLLYTADRADLEWPASQAEQETLWEAKLTYEVLNEVLMLLYQEKTKQEKAAKEKALKDPDSKISLKEVPSSSVELEISATEAGGKAEKQASGEDSPAVVQAGLKAAQDAEAKGSVEEPLQAFAHQKAPAVELEGGVVLTDALYQQALSQLEKRYNRVRTNIEEFEPGQVQEFFLQTFAESVYDPNSSFFSVESLSDLKIKIQSSVSGIGVILANEDGVCTVKEVLPGGPAALDKRLKPQDKIVGVRQADETETIQIEGMKLEKSVQLIRGPKGTRVSLEVIPAQAADPSVRQHIELVRDEVKVAARVAHGTLYTLPKGDGQVWRLGVVQLPAFYSSEEDGTGNSTDDVREIIEKLKSKGAEGIILDLRNNLGGLLTEAVRLTGLFISEGPVLQLKNHLGQVAQYIDKDSRVAWTGPLLLLVNAFTASSSEIVAGALKDSRYARALVVGEKTTHQKGSIQALYEIDTLLDQSPLQANKRPTYGAFKITVQQYCPPDGNPVQGQGVASDIVLRSINDHLPVREVDIPNSMKGEKLPSLRFEVKDRDLWNKAPVTSELIDYLKARSQQRQSSLPEFKVFHQSVDWFEEKQKIKEFSLNLAERWAQKLKDMAFKEKLDKELESCLKNRPEGEEILLDSVLHQKNQTATASVLPAPSEGPQNPAQGAASAAEKDASGPNLSGSPTPLGGRADGPSGPAALAQAAPRAAEAKESPKTTPSASELPAPAGPEEEEASSEEEGLDVHLKEGLEILKDWMDLLQKPQAQPAVTSGGAIEGSLSFAYGLPRRNPESAGKDPFPYAA